MGYPYPSFCLCAFWGPIKTPVLDSKDQRSEGRANSDDIKAQAMKVLFRGESFGLEGLAL